MNKELGTWLAIGTTVFAVGAGWATLNGKIDRLDEKIASVEQKQAEPLCLTVLTAQMKAMEAGKLEKYNEQLNKLSVRYCPQGGVWQNANYTLGAPSEEQRLRERIEANETLARIIAEVGAPNP
jgi:hypothetical protein